jgi:cytokinin dehydrogenase
LQVRWIRALYSNFSEFTADQERLISLRGGVRRFDYVEGFVVAAEGLINNWRSSFFSPQNPVKLSSLKHHTGVLYCLEVTKNYDDDTAASVDQVSLVHCSSAPPLLSLILMWFCSG